MANSLSLSSFLSTIHCPVIWVQSSDSVSLPLLLSWLSPSLFPAPQPQSLALLTLHFLHSKVNILSLSQQIALREEHINTETCSYYITPLSFTPTHTLLTSDFLNPFIFLSLTHSSNHSDLSIPVFVSLSLLRLFLYPLSSPFVLYGSLVCFSLHPLLLSLSLQRYAMNI